MSGYNLPPGVSVNDIPGNSDWDEPICPISKACDVNDPCEDCPRRWVEED